MQRSSPGTPRETARSHSGGFRVRDERGAQSEALSCALSHNQPSSAHERDLAVAETSVCSSLPVRMKERGTIAHRMNSQVWNNNTQSIDQ